MSKELTEQWRNGTLEESMYYVKLPNNDIPIVNLYQLKQLALVNDADEIEVLAHVPTYDQFADLSKKVNQFSQLVKKVEDLKTLIKDGRFVEALKVLED